MVGVCGGGGRSGMGSYRDLRKVRPGRNRCTRRMTTEIVERETSAGCYKHQPCVRQVSIMSSRHSHQSLPLLNPSPHPPSYNSLRSPPSPAHPRHDPPPLNHLSRLDFFSIVSALWSAVFLGALDGTFQFQSISILASLQTCPNRHSRSHTRVSHR